MRAMNQINWRRWLPTSAPLISGAVASAVVLGLRKLGIVVLPHEISEAVTPAIAFLTAAIVHKPSEGQVKNLEHAEATTLGSILACEFQGRLDSDPDLIQRVLNVVLPSAVAETTPTGPFSYDWVHPETGNPSNTAAANPGQPRSNYGAVIGTASAVTPDPPAQGTTQPQT